jgi:hypothetical protein
MLRGVGSRVTAPREPGTVARVITDWSHEVVETGWKHDTGAPLSLYVVDLEGDGGRVTLMPDDVTLRECGRDARKGRCCGCECR